MLSRVANSIYWMGRYLERAENLARIIDVHSNLTLDMPGQGNGSWLPLIYATGDQDVFASRYDSQSRESVIQFLAFDAEYGNSLISCVKLARENARSIRENLPPELWEQINHLYHLLHRSAPDPTRDAQELYGFFTYVKMVGLSFGGIINDTMSHTEGWNWFRCGRLLERADKTSRILDVKYFTVLPQTSDIGSPYDQIQWTGLLKSTSALEAYRSWYGQLTRENIIEFLILNRTFPRAVLHCLIHADEMLRAILGTYPNHFQNRAEQLLGQLCSEVSYASIDGVIQTGLHEYIDVLQTRVNQVGEAIQSVYFSA